MGLTFNEAVDDLFGDLSKSKSLPGRCVLTVHLPDSGGRGTASLTTTACLITWGKCHFHCIF